MNDKYYLYYVDYNDSLDEHTDVLVRCLEDGCADHLYEKVDEWFMDCEDYSVKEILENLKNEVVELGYGEDEVEAFFENHEYLVREEIYNRDYSDPIGDLLRNTSEIPVRIEMITKNDYYSPDYNDPEDSYSYRDSYIGNIIDVLNLNPYKVKKLLEERDTYISGKFPDLINRNGNELVSYDNFHIELENCSCDYNKLTFLAKICPKELYEAGFKISKVSVPSGNFCGLFSSDCGGGSIMEMELRSRMTFNLKPRCKSLHLPYYELIIDDGNYCAGSVYGLCDSAYGDYLTIVA